jgi:hypothetical protein
MRSLVFAIGMLLANGAQAAQVIPTGVEYTNDTIEQAGALQACEVTVAIINPPAPEIVNFQLLVVLGRPGFKITAGDINWSQQSSVAKIISAAEFSTADFDHPNAFQQSVTQEGQLLAFIKEPDLGKEFIRAFFGGRYSIRFRRTDSNEDRVYYIEQAPGVDVLDKFTKCLHTLAAAAK